MALTLYQYDISPYCDKVRRALHYKQLDHAIVEVLISQPGKHKAVSPTGKFPALRDGETIIVDSTEILKHLEAIAPEPALTPASARDRALAVILEDWADESLYFYDLSMRGWPQNRAAFLDDLLRHEPPGVKRGLLAKLIPGALGKVARTQGLGRKSEAQVGADLAMLYGALEAMLVDTPFLAGPALSGADLGVRSMVGVIDHTVEGLAIRRGLPGLSTWCARVDALTLPGEAIVRPTA